MSSLENLKPLAVAYGEVVMKIKELEEAKKELEKELKPALADQGTLAFDEFTVEFKTYEGRKTLDKAALEATYGDLTSFMKQGAPYIRASVKKLAGAV